MSKSKTAVVVVESESHFLPGHPESPARFRHFDNFRGQSWSDDLTFLQPLELDSRDLESVHTQNYIGEIQAACAHGPAILDLGDTYVTQASLQCALTSAGASLAVLDYALAHKGGRGFALARPPGHHATATHGMGFCLVNNIALTARRALESGLEKVMIIDFDVHHGNGTQAIFFEQPQVLYLSTHQSGIYPGTGRIQEIGASPAQGTTINVPLPAFTGDAGFERIFDQIIGPAARRFMPQILLVSAGYDAHWQDPLAQLQLTTNGYHHLSTQLVALADEVCEGRVVFILEGGYNPQALFEGVEAGLTAMTGRPRSEAFPKGGDRLQEPDINPVIEAVVDQHNLKKGA